MMKKDRKLNSIIVVTFLTLLVFVAFSSEASAAGEEVSVSIPVELKISGDVPSAPTSFSFMLSPATAETPMPTDSAGGGSTLSIQGNATANFSKIVFTEPGDYYYTVKQTGSTIADYTLETTEYTVLICVTIEENRGLTAVISATKAGGEKKQDALLFTNEYHQTANSTPSGGTTVTGNTKGLPQTGDTSHLTLWYLLLTLSGIGLIFFAYLNRRNKKAK